MGVNFSLLLAVTIVNLILAFFIFWKNPKNRINVSFSFVVLGVALWSLTNAICLRTETLKWAIFWSEVSYFSAIVIGISFFHFSLVFPATLASARKIKTEKLYKIIIVVIGFLVSIALFVPQFTVKTVIIRPWKIVTGPGLYVFAAYFLGIITWALIKLIKNFLISRGRERIQLTYLFWGIVLSLAAGTFLNLILPLYGIYDLVWLGPLFTLIMISFIGYAIVAHQLFEIRIVLTTFFVSLMAILLLFDIMSSASTFDYVWRGLIFTAFLLFGYLLIRSVLREIHQRERMEKMAQELRVAYEKVKELDKSKSEFISIASHQLRTPLTAIIGYLSMVLEGTYGKLSDKMKKPVSNVFRVSRQLNQLVNTLLSVSRIEAGKIKLEAKPMSLEKILNHIVEEFEVVAKEKGLYLKLEIPSPLPLVPLDEEKINQVIMNIVDNGIKYTETGGIIIKCKMENEKLKIKIADTGLGMEKEQLGQIFEKFARGTAGQQSWAGGAGLGLFIARKFVELHKGKIYANSEGPNKGSVFSIELPTN